MKKTGKASQSKWIQKRRAAVQKLADGSGASSSRRVAKPSRWCDGQEEEDEKQKQNQLKRKLDAYQDGLLLHEEIDDDLRSGLQEKQVRNRQNDRKILKDREKLQKIISRMHAKIDWEQLSGKRVWMPDDILTSMHRALVTYNLRPTSDRCAADVFVVGDPLSPGERVQWLSLLAGRPVVAKVVLESGSTKNGVVVWPEPVLKNKQVHLTPKFRARHPELTDVVESCARPGQFSVSRPLRAKTHVICTGQEKHDAPAPKNKMWHSKGTFAEDFGWVKASMLGR